MVEYYEYASDRDASTLLTLGLLYLQGNGYVCKSVLAKKRNKQQTSSIVLSNETLRVR